MSSFSQVVCFAISSKQKTLFTYCASFTYKVFRFVPSVPSFVFGKWNFPVGIYKGWNSQLILKNLCDRYFVFAHCSIIIQCFIGRSLFRYYVGGLWVAESVKGIWKLIRLLKLWFKRLLTCPFLEPIVCFSLRTKWLAILIRYLNMYVEALWKEGRLYFDIRSHGYVART